MILRLIFKEFRNTPRGMLAVTAILFVGFLGPLITSMIRSSTQDYLQSQARSRLGADLVVSAMRDLTAEERAVLHDVFQPEAVSEDVELVSMVVGPTSSALSEVRAVDADWPLYGGFLAREEGRSAGELQTDRVVWASAEALMQIGANLGDQIQIGRQSFRISAVLSDEAGLNSTRFGGFAPRIFIGRPFLEETGLTGFGSQVFYRLNYRFGSGGPTGALRRLETGSTEGEVRGPPRVDKTAAEAASPGDPDSVARADRDLGEITAGDEMGRGSSSALETLILRARDRLGPTELVFRTPEDAIRGLQRFLQFFSRYLAVITLVVFSLSWMSAFYILQVFVQDRLRNAAIFMTLGAGRIWVQFLFALQILLVSLMAFASAVLATWVVSRIAPVFLEGRVPEGFRLLLHGGDVARLTVISVLSALTFTLPLFVKIQRLKPQTLLAETATGLSKSDAGTPLLSYLPMLLIFWLLALWLMESVAYAGWLVAGLLGAAFVIWGLGQALFHGLRAGTRDSTSMLRLVFIHLSRARFGMRLCFLTLALVALILNVVPHLLESVLKEVRPGEGAARPSLFLFNIPEESLASLDRFVKDRDGRLEYVSPMILARLRAVNSEPPSDPRAQRFPLRLTYRDQFVPSETLIAGRLFNGAFDPQTQERPEISMEARYAERNGYQIGDIMTFDVMGLPVEGVVVNLRRVRWTDFHPNFFMEFQPGVLEDAPKTWIANVVLPSGKESEVQTELVRRFPELSVVDVGQALRQIQTLTEAMVGPMQAVAWTAVIVSFLILGAVISHNLRLRRLEVDVLRLLGANAGRIRGLILQEYAWMAILASGLGALFGVGITVFVTRQMFEIATGFALGALVLSNVVILMLTLGIVARASRRALHLKATSVKF